MSYSRRRHSNTARQTVTPELVERARAGDLEACGALVDATEGLVRAAVRRVTLDAALADDAVQETYVRAFGALRSLRSAEAFPAWLSRVAVSTARNEVRRRRGAAVDPVVLDALPARVADDPDGDRLRAALHRAIVALPERERRLCDRYYHGAWTTRRVAAEDGSSEAALRKRLQRVRDRLRREMEMTLSTPGEAGDLSARIVELLSRPCLLDLPENPVGAVWERIVATHGDCEVVELAEELTEAQVAQTVGAEHARIPCSAHRIDEVRFLRHDLTVPMLIAARGRPPGVRLLGAGKVYRDDHVDRAHLQAFHQAAMLWTGPRLSHWDAMEVLSSILDDLLPGARLRIQEMPYESFADGGWEVNVQQGDEWITVAGCARFADRVVERLGLDPQKHAAVGLGLGLERVAGLRYGIDDLRRVETTSVSE